MKLDNLEQLCDKVVHGCLCLFTVSYTKYWQGGGKVVTILSQACNKVVTSRTTTLLQPCYNLVHKVVATLNKLGIPTWVQAGKTA